MTNKAFIAVFIVLYLGSFFYVIFFRIESWPFSDYRVYSHHTHPKRIKTYIPYFRLSDGSYVPPIVNNKIILLIDKPHFQKAYLKYNSSDYDTYINKLLKSKTMRQAVKRMREQNLFPAQFIIMEVKFKEKKKHKWIPVYTPVKKYDIL